MVEDGEGAVELLHEEEAHHLVVEGHLRQGYLVVGGGIDGDVAEADLKSVSAEPDKRKEGARNSEAPSWFLLMKCNYLESTASLVLKNLTLLRLMLVAELLILFSTSDEQTMGQ